MDKISNLLFDFGNVLIDIDIEGAWERLSELRNPQLSKDQVETEVNQLTIKYEVGQISTDLFINGMLKYARKDVQAIDVIEAWNSMLIGIPVYRLSMLEQLREAYNVVLLSNTNELHIEWVYRHLKQDLGVEDFDHKYFDDTYYSHEIHLRKPDAECFHHVCENSFITPSRTLFMDDHPPNIEAANRLGFQTHLSPPDEEIAEVLKLRGIY